MRPDSRTNGGDTRAPPLPVNSPYYYHPIHGPVPNSVPQTYMQTTVLRVQNRCGQMGHPPHCTCVSDPMCQPLYSPFASSGYQNHTHQGRVSSLSNSSFSSGYVVPPHAHSPSHSECFYGNQMTSPPSSTQFASPPPPPYSPQGAIKIPASINHIHPTQEHHSFTTNPGPRSMNISDQPNNQTSPSDSGCGPLPTLPLSPDEVVSLPSSGLIPQSHPEVSGECTS